MITKTNFLRIAALSAALLASPVTILAENAFEKAIEFVTKREEIKATLRNILTEEDVECALAHTQAVSKAAQELYENAKNASWRDIETLQAMLEEIKVYQETIIPQLDDYSKVLWKADLNGKYMATNDRVVTSLSIEDAFDYATKKTKTYEYFKDLCTFARELITGSTYVDAWQDLYAAKGFNNTMVAVNRHPAALTGVIVALTTAATIYLCRDNIKARWNRLFGSSVKTDETQTA